MLMKTTLNPVSLISTDDGKIIMICGLQDSITEADVRNFFRAMDLCSFKDIAGVYIDVMVPDLVAICAEDMALRRKLNILDELPALPKFPRSRKSFSAA